MSRFFIAIVCCMLLFACKPGIPKKLIQPDQMEQILFDIHVIDGYASTFGLATPDSLKKIISPYYKGIYKKHGVDSALYNQSLNYYYKHPEVMKLMYDHVTEKLSKAKDKSQKADAKVVVVAKPVATIKKVDTLKKIDSAKRIDSIKKVQPKKIARVVKPKVKKAN